MATAAEQLATIKTQTLATIVTITATPKPSYTIDGQAISWGTYLKQLQDTVKWVDTQLVQAGGPYEVHSQGYT